MPAQWTCSTCYKDFQRKGDLTRHQHLHTGYKPHVCDKCGKAFAQYTGLKTHRNVHTRERPYKCTICTTSFSDPSSCARHRRETHENPAGYKCHHPGCKTSIKRRSCFVKHLRQKHGFNHAEIKVETDLLEVPDRLYQISSPESSGSTSGSDYAVDVVQWDGYDFQDAPARAVTSKPSDRVDGSVLFANSSWASPPRSSSAIDGLMTSTQPSIPVFSNPQVDLSPSSTADTTMFLNSLLASCFEPTYEYPSWAGSPSFTPPSSLCPSLSSSPAPVTPEHQPSHLMPEAVAVRYANFIPVQSSKDDGLDMHYAYAPFQFANIV